MSHVSMSPNSHPKHTHFIQSKYLIHVNFILNRFCRASTMSQEEPLELGSKENKLSMWVLQPQSVRNLIERITNGSLVQGPAWACNKNFPQDREWKGEKMNWIRWFIPIIPALRGWRVMTHKLRITVIDCPVSFLLSGPSAHNCFWNVRKPSSFSSVWDGLYLVQWN